VSRHVCRFALTGALLATSLVGCGSDHTTVRTVTVERTTTVAAASTTAPVRERTEPTEPTETSREESSVPTGFVRCDANIEIKQSTTTCPFGSNVFYEYWRSGQKHVVRAYSAAVERVFTTRCAVQTADIRCSTTDGGVVRFSQAAIDRYSTSQADSYAANHDLGPDSTTPDASTLDSSASPDSSAGSVPDSADFCATHNCIPNYENGNGSTVQCADGSYSHSGGIQGACSHHGGVR